MKILNQFINFFLKEEIYSSNQVIAYHYGRSPKHLQDILVSGLHAGKKLGSAYNIGFYGVYDLGSQRQIARMVKNYGNCILKYKCNTTKYFNFDDPLAKENILEYINNFPYLSTKLKIYLKNNIIPKNFTNKLDITSDIASRFAEGLGKEIDGIMFTGKRDGKVIVSYNLNTVIPMKYGVVDVEYVDENAPHGVVHHKINSLEIKWTNSFSEFIEKFGLINLKYLKKSSKIDKQLEREREYNTPKIILLLKEYITKRISTFSQTISIFENAKNLNLNNVLTPPNQKVNNLLYIFSFSNQFDPVIWLPQILIKYPNQQLKEININLLNLSKKYEDFSNNLFENLYLLEYNEEDKYNSDEEGEDYEESSSLQKYFDSNNWSNQFLKKLSQEETYINPKTSYLKMNEIIPFGIVYNSLISQTIKEKIPNTINQAKLDYEKASQNNLSLAEFLNNNLSFYKIYKLYVNEYISLFKNLIKISEKYLNQINEEIKNNNINEEEIYPWD